MGNFDGNLLLLFQCNELIYLSFLYIQLLLSFILNDNGNWNDNT